MGRKPKALIEAIAHTSAFENTSPLKIEKPEAKLHKNPARLQVSKKISKDKRVIVRRSGRIQNIARSSQNQENQTMVEQINLVESEKEDELNVEREDETRDEREDEIRDEREVEIHDEREVETSDKEHTPEPIPSKSSLEDKIDRLIETVEELKYEVTEIRPSTDLIYKSLYIESKKKIEALTDENYQLSKKLEIALLKLEAYEGVKEMFDKMVTDVTKANEAVGNLSSQAALYKLSPPAAAAKQPSVYRKRKANEAVGNLSSQAALSKLSLSPAAKAKQPSVDRKRHNSKAKK